MAITGLNHAVLYVRDLVSSVGFYQRVLGFERIDMTPEGFAGAVFLRAPDSDNDHDLGLFEIGEQAGPSEAGLHSVGLYHLGWEVDTLAELERIRGGLDEHGALVGTSDHGTTKSLYGKDPDGQEFEVAWIVPAALLDEAALNARKSITTLNLDNDKRRYGADTLGNTRKGQ